MPDELLIPIVQEEAQVAKRTVVTERVAVHSRVEEEAVTVRDTLRREHVEVTRVPQDREVERAPGIRTEGEVTIVPVLEERLVVEKRLFLVEELHLRRTATTERVALPTTLRRTRIEVERTATDREENP